MNISSHKIISRLALTIVGAVLGLLLTSPAAVGQNSELQQKLAAFKEKQAQNKQQLAQYTWQETEVISLKGEVKDTKIYQVRIGPDGKPAKTLTSNQQASSGGGRQGRLKEHVIEKKKAEFQEYGQQIGALAKQYTQPNPDLLAQAKQQGNISLQPMGDGTLNLVIKNYIKPNDSVTLTINDQTKQLASIKVASYLNDPKDAVTIDAQFAQLPDGTNHVANTQVNGVSKQLTVSDQNANYQKL